ncbi:MAG: hypothetical protein GXO48_00240 [Chlorobi bacterium]|nr:hypothetical protein [Chlorobiota bacterium]
MKKRLKRINTFLFFSLGLFVISLLLRFVGYGVIYETTFWREEIATLALILHLSAQLGLILVAYRIKKSVVFIPKNELVSPLLILWYFTFVNYTSKLQKEIIIIGSSLIEITLPIILIDTCIAFSNVITCQ